MKQNNPDHPVYGIYCWSDEYVRHHSFIREVGWTSLRLGKVEEEAVRLMVNDEIEVMPILGSRIGDNETDEQFITRYLSAIDQLLGRYGQEGSFFKENPDLPRRPFVHLEICNEPNFHYLDGKKTMKDRADRTATESRRASLYGKLLVASYEHIKKRWPFTQVVGFATGGAANADGRFIREAHELNSDVASSYDILSTHPYVSGPPEADAIQTWGAYSIASALSGIRNTLSEFGGSSRIWYSELNWEIESSLGGRYQKQNATALPLLHQAAYHVRGYALALRLGVERLHYMSLVDTDGCNSGFLNRDGTRRPSADAVQTMIKVLPRPKLIGAVKDGEENVYIYRFNPDYNSVEAADTLMAWCVTGPREIIIPWNSNSAEIIDMLGNRVTRTAGLDGLSIEIGPYPVYIR